MSTYTYHGTLINKLLKLRNNEFVRNVATVASGAASAQAINLILAPIITRLYGPEAFGLLGTFVALITVIAPITVLSYPIAIVLPKEDSEAEDIVRLSILTSIILSLVITILLVSCGDRFLILVKAQRISDYIYFIPICVIFSGWTQIAVQWLLRKKQFKIIAQVNVLQVLFINILKIGIGLFNPAAAALIIVSTLGNVVQTVMLVVGSKNRTRLNITKKLIFKKTTWGLAKKLYEFPLYRTPQIAIYTFSQNIPVLMLASLFGPLSAGFYTLARRVLGLPLQIISSAVGDVFYPRITEALHKGQNTHTLIIKSTLWLSLIGFLPFTITLAFGPCLFTFVFGQKWLVAGEYTRWLSILMFTIFINRPCVAAVPALNLQKGFLLYEICITFAEIASLYIGFIKYKDDKIAVALFSIVGSICYLIMIIWVIIRSKMNR